MPHVDTSIATGQIVSFRKRLWRINAIAGEEFAATPIEGALESHRFLTALEHPEPASLPLPDYSAIGDALHQDLLVRAYRLSMIHGSAPFLSLQRSSIVPINYQLVPLMMALQQAFIRLLIGDDVGLGKTIEAGLILSEALARGRVRRVFIIVPASLREQWQQALSYLFHIETVILSSQSARQWQKELPTGSSPWHHFERLIVSIDYAKTVEHRIQLLDAIDKRTMVIVDEAHIAGKPHEGVQHGKVDMDRWNLVKQVAEKTPHLLLLTATPHNGYTDSFASLIRMVCSQAVSGPDRAPEINKRIARSYVCQRARKDIEKWLSEQNLPNPFPQRDAKEEIIPLHPSMQKMLSEVELYTARLIQTFGGRGRKALIARWLAMHLQRRALSSPAALRCSLDNRIREIDRRLKKPEEDTATTDEHALAATLFDRDPGEATSEEEARRRADLAAILESNQLLKEKESIVQLLESARKIKPQQDSKLRHMAEDILPPLLKQDGRVIVFTRYYDTLQYLVENLPAYLPKGTLIVSMHGEMSEAQRRETFSKLERSDKCVLIATDVISEGLNLQHACSQVVHYELPWNPNRLEQRNGRVDRFAQPRPVVRIRTLVMDHWLDHAILELLILKARKIRDERGFSPPFWGDEQNILDLLQRRGRQLKDKYAVQKDFFGALFTEDEQEDVTETDDPLSDEVLERVSKDCFYGDVDVALPDVQSRLERSRTLIGSPEQIERFVRQALSHYHCTVKEEKDKSLTILLPDPRLQLHQIGSELRKATFAPELALSDPDLVVLDIGHPLVRRLVDLVKEDFFRTSAETGRASSMVVAECGEVIAHYRYLVRFAGAEDQSVLEELVDVAYPVYGKGGTLSEAELARIVSATPKARMPKPDECRPHFEEAWKSPAREKGLRAATEARRLELVRERLELRDKIKKSNPQADTAWLDHAKDLSVVSYDLLTATLYLPR